MEKLKNDLPLDQEENDLKDALESLNVKKISKPSPARQKALIEAATNYSQKETKMNIRINPADLEAIKQKAVEEGLKYQPFVRSILHKYVTGQLVRDRSCIGNPSIVKKEL